MWFSHATLERRVQEAHPRGPSGLEAVHLVGQVRQGQVPKAVAEKVGEHNISGHPGPLIRFHVSAPAEPGK